MEQVRIVEPGTSEVLEIEEPRDQILVQKQVVELLTIGMQGPPGPPGTPGQGAPVRETFTAPPIALQFEPLPSSEYVTLNGLILAPGVDYTLVGSTISLQFEFLPGDVITVGYMQ